MFNRDGLFGKKDDNPRSDLRTPVNVTPGLSGGAPTPTRPQSQSQAQAQPQPQTQNADLTKPDLRFVEPAKQMPRAEEPAGSKLIVGPDIKLKGVEITDCDTLVVEGRVEASMDSRVVQIAEKGVFAGTVSIDVAEIRGRFEGELTARKQLVIYSTGKVSGRIRYGQIRIEEGGELSGNVSTLSTSIASTEVASSGSEASRSEAVLSGASTDASAATQDSTPSRSAQAPTAASQKPAAAPHTSSSPVSTAPSPTRSSRHSNKSNASVNTTA